MWIPSGSPTICLERRELVPAFAIVAGKDAFGTPNQCSIQSCGF
jgi:hypothetical protein